MRRTPLARKTPLKAKAPIRRRPVKRKDGAAGRAYMAKVARLPCAVANANCRGRITVHHRSGAGMALRASDFDTMPLCFSHHLVGPEAIHGIGSKAWEALHQVSQAELVAWTRKMVETLANDA